MDRLRNPAHLIGLAIALLASAIKGDLIPPGAVKYTVYAMGALGLVGTYLFDGFTAPSTKAPAVPPVALLLLAFLVPSLALAAPTVPTAHAQPVADPSPPVIVLPVEATPTATAPTAAAAMPSATADLLRQLQALDAAQAALKRSLGVPDATTLPPTFWATTGGKVLIAGMGLVGSGLAALEAYAATRVAAMPPSSAGQGTSAALQGSL